MRTPIIAAFAVSMLTPIAAAAQTYASSGGQRATQVEDRQDWREYRRAHMDVYRQDAYRGPRGYSYRPVAAGHQFQPAYYGRDHWVTDYRRYHLSRPPVGQQWVRYANDVVLVVLNSGRVAYSIPGFFH